MFRTLRTLALCALGAVTLWILGLSLRSQKTAEVSEKQHPERGDVPGWVMITMMSAILVAAILAAAQPALLKMFNDAMARIRPIQ